MKKLTNFYYKKTKRERPKLEALFDQALVFMKNVNGQRPICYVAKNWEVPKVFEFERNPKLIKNFRVIRILNRLSTVLLFRVQTEVEINEGYYVKYALTSLLPIHFHCFYSRDMDKVCFTLMKPSSHTSVLNIDYLR